MDVRPLIYAGHDSVIVRVPIGRRLVRAIVSLGDGLDLPITAEGIEDMDILAKLRTMGPLKGQGYHYGRPETTEAVRQRLEAAGLLVSGTPDRSTPEPESTEHRKTG